ncbi:ribonuclease P protein subunit p40 [Lampris incognitus]|uniref:ribonuclease P protein subunit p40 n=1 Tax=Lampris incognitus TaxID=2546036 RepID=UPI0024B4C4C3|nr:ribonuclease P protein subunit p40 [Lampris incognitus]XP_056148775.1 ribonuclease P protein subunit p40 [Lampris incognitus]
MSAGLDRTPRTLLVCEKSSFDHDKSRLRSHVAQHCFNYKVSLLVPECDVFPPHLERTVNNFSRFYLVHGLPVYALLDKDFLETAVFKGSIYGLSYKTRIDEDNTFALLPSGRLVLSLDKDTYEVLGVEGKPSQYSSRRALRYVVTVDLKDASWAPGGKQYQRLLTSLKERLRLQSDFLLSQHHTDGGGSLEGFLSAYEWTEHRPQISHCVLTDLPCPDLVSSDLRGESQSCDPHSFLEWLGAVDAGAGCHNESSSFLSTYVCPEPNSVASRALRCCISGLLLPEDLFRLLEQMRRYFDQPKLTSWLAMTVHGMADSPVSWGTTEHGFLKGGENFYSLVVFQNHDYWLYMGTGSHDSCPP